MTLWTAEQVNVDDLHDNAVFYLTNPLLVETPLFAPPHCAGQVESDADVQAGNIVWILFASDAQRTSYFKPYRAQHRIGELSGLRAIGEAVGMPYYNGFGGFTK